jgi:hypothetical protein
MIFSDGSRIMGQQARSKCGTSDTPLGCCEVKFPTNAEFLVPAAAGLAQISDRCGVLHLEHAVCSSNLRQVLGF